MSIIFQSFDLPNGARLANRLCKAAMEENLADKGQLPGARLKTLYRQWTMGGVGLILTGNVMVAPDALTGPGGVVLEKGQPLTPFRDWAEAAKSGGAAVWMQLNHPGRQVYASMGEPAFAPSALGVEIRGFSSLFPIPQALNQRQIQEIIERFANSASLAEQAGFDGCQIHAAHGYLISQFLSPLTNKRTDQWGGSIENRARFLFDVLAAVKSRVSDQFCVSVKLNSADFQKGGFDLDDACWVVEKLNRCKVDLVELSGGSYESPAMQGNSSDDSTGEREAYFIDFARKVSRVADMPIMVTGGIRKYQVAEKAMQRDIHGAGVDMLGIARAMAFVPDLPKQWRDGKQLDVFLPQVKWKNKTLAALATMAITKWQLSFLSKGKTSQLAKNPVVAILRDRIGMFLLTKRYQRWRKRES